MKVPIARFFEAAARASGFSIEDLRLRKYDRSVSWWRKVAAYEAVREGWTKAEVGRYLGRTSASDLVNEVGFAIRSDDDRRRRSAQAATDHVRRELLPPMITTEEVSP